ncbi:suppressor of fused domain protein [Schlesneria sp. T3-172]|uniref:suppressor of fused domain protein n=1 Tax=Schlesneria sphaerica TaxID=3373610 RepID=UPI0037C892F1
MAIIFRCDHCNTRYRVDLEKAGCRAKCRQCGRDLVVPDAKQSDHPVERPRVKKIRSVTKPVHPVDSRKRRKIADHIESTIGPIDFIFHELVSEYVQIDVYRVPPQTNHPYYTLVTSGMSELPMTVPDGAEALRYAELMLCLPRTWNLGMDDFRDERHYWPIRLLKVLARLPHEFQTWLGPGHSVPNGVPPLTYASNTHFCGAVLMPPLNPPTRFRTLDMGDDEEIHFYAVIPLYADEMECKVQKGMNYLIDRLDRAEVNEVIDIQRKNTCKKSWFDW